VALVLDAHDTFVTRRTAEAVLRRKDRIGYTIVVRTGARLLITALDALSPIWRHVSQQPDAVAL
jgi:hypothetical protein